MNNFETRPRVGFIQKYALGLLAEGFRTSFGGAEVRAVSFAEMLLDSGRFEVAFAVMNEFGRETPKASLRGMPLHGIPVQAWESPGDPCGTGFGLDDLLCGMFESMNAQILVTLGANEVAQEMVHYAHLLGIRSVVGIASDQNLDLGVFRGSMVIDEYGVPHGQAWDAMHRADGVLAQTVSQMDWLHHLTGRKGILIPNPIPLGWVGLRAPERNAFSFDFLWIGRSGPDKNPAILFEAARELPAATFKVVLDNGLAGVPEEWRDSLPANVLVSDRLRSVQEVRELMSVSRAMVNTSPAEGFPNLMLQGAMVGCPTLFLCVDPDGWGTEHGCAATALGDFERFLALLSRALGDGPWLGAMAARARNLALERHAPTLIQAKMVEAMDQLLGMPIPRRR